jgi:23S rRNA G2445 N2-methylase RlmL
MSVFDEPRTLHVACCRGAAPFLAAELRALGFPVTAEHESGVESSGTVTDAMRLNLHLRTANRVLYEIGAFRAQSPLHLYRHLLRLPWEAFLPANERLTVTSFVSTSAVRDPRLVNLKSKDAIVDRIRGKTGRRPDSGGERTGAVVFLYWNGSAVKVYLDTSGETLSRRGYRKIPLDAPMQETLASAVVLATGWNGSGHFVNPMCGSGTLAIEAAMIGLGIVPELLRGGYGFMHLSGFAPSAWQALRAAAAARSRALPGGRIIATDIRPEAVDAAKRNARAAGVEEAIEFGVCDFAETPIPAGDGVVLLNPEYGERMGSVEALGPLYRRIGDFFKQKCLGYAGYIFTGNLDLAKQVGLRSSRRLPFWNGPIECRLLRFDLYAGTRRRRYALDEPPNDEPPGGADSSGTDSGSLGR